jgi:hypothetical protein
MCWGERRGAPHGHVWALGGGVAGAESRNVLRAREGVVHCHLEGRGRGAAGVGVFLDLSPAVILLTVQGRLP